MLSYKSPCQRREAKFWKGTANPRDDGGRMSDLRKSAFVSRTLEVREVNGTERPVLVLMGAPEPVEDEEDFRCPYQILGLGDERIRYAHGVDTMQAFLLSFVALRAHLDASPEGREGRITWLGGEDWGFPK